ncbi:PAS domain S-box protein [Myxococcota bacterium]
MRKRRRTRKEIEAALVRLRRRVSTLERAVREERGLATRTCWEAVLKASCDQAPHAAGILDLEGTLRYANRAACAFLGLEPSEVLGRALWDTPGCSHSEDQQQRLRDGVRSGALNAVQFETTHCRADGTLHCIDLTLRPLRDDANGISCLVFEGRDITAHKLAELALRAKTEEVDRYYLHALDLLCVADTEGYFRRLNHEWEAVLGYSVAELEGSRYLDYVHPDDVDATGTALAQLRADQEVLNFVNRCRTKDGSYRWLEWRSVPRGGLVYAVARDITDSRRSQEALRRSEERYRALVETQLDLISRYRPDTVLTFVNDAYCRFYGKTRAELIGHSFLRMVDAEFHPKVLAETEELVKHPTTLVGEYLNYRKDGQACWIQWVIQGIVDEKGRVVELQAVGRDITPLKQAEEALRQANLVVESSPVVLFRWLATPGWPVVYVSENVRHFVGYAPHELLRGAIPFSTLVHPDDLSRVLSEVEQYSAAGIDRFQQEYRIVTQTGGVRWVDDRTVIERDADGRATHYQGILIDITERRSAEEERKALQSQLQQAMKMEAVGRLAGGVAHDFSNLLTAIAGNIELARLERSPNEPPTHCLDEASKAAESAAALIRQLLTFSRRQIIEPRVLDLNHLVEGLQKMLVRLIGEDIALSFVASEDLGFVKVDPGQFEQVLVNLAVNARDAMPEGGRLLIETANAEIDEDYRVRHHPCVLGGPFVMLSVSDTGHGMSDYVKQHLFEPFFTTKPQGCGTGLGLATTFGIVQQAGGTVDVYSEVGHGTTFRLYLPTVSAPAEELPEVEPAPPLLGGSETILLVEDDASVRALAKLFLTRLGYRVLVASNGQEAFSQAEEWGLNISLLLTDVVMPGMTGRELSDRLRSMHPSLKVLFSSGYTKNVMVQHGVLNGQVNFIAKPYTIQELAEKVRCVLAETTPCANAVG